MRLNPDCIRDILLATEKFTDIKKVMVYSNNPSDFDIEGYTPNEVLYHIQQCDYSGLIICSRFNQGFIIKDLTPTGHEFLANIRTNTNWNKTKEISKKIGSNSLNTLFQIASNVVSELLKNQF